MKRALKIAVIIVVTPAPVLLVMVIVLVLRRRRGARARVAIFFTGPSQQKGEAGMKIGQTCWAVIDGKVHKCIYRGQKKGKAMVESEHLANNDVRHIEMKNVCHTQQTAEDAVVILEEHEKQRQKYERKQHLIARRGQIEQKLKIGKRKNRLENLEPGKERDRSYAFHPMYGEVIGPKQVATATVGLRELGDLIAESETVGEYAARHDKLINFILLVDEEVGPEKVDELLSRVLT